MSEPAAQVRKGEQSLSVIIGGDYSRKLAHGWIDTAAPGYVITVEREPRSLEQSDKFYAICSDLASSTITWDGERQTKDEWHDLLIHAWMVATRKHTRLKRGLEGGMVSCLLSTRRLRKNEMSELIDYAVVWATSHGLNVTGEA